MAPEIVAAVLGAVVGGGLALLGAWLQHRWAEGATQRREAQSQAARARSVRFLIGLELDQNLGRLTPFVESIRDQEERWRATYIATTPAPPLIRRAWEALIEDLASAFDVDVLDRIARGYQSVDELEAIRAELVAMRERDHLADINPPMMDAPFGRGLPTRLPADHELDSSSGRRLAEDWLRVASEALAVGNPLRG